VVTPEEVAARAASGEDAPLLLDVRTPGEFLSHHIPGALLIPVDELNRRYQELDPDRPTVCVCEHGIRSEAAAAFLARQDFADVSTMRGGMVRWTGPVERG
jgi:rhodanese-related sulfurtransferase